MCVERREMRMRVCGGNPKVIDHESAYLEDLGIDGRFILKCIFMK
jgi:hypothetical protein